MIAFVLYEIFPSFICTVMRPDYHETNLRMYMKTVRYTVQVYKLVGITLFIIINIPQYSEGESLIPNRTNMINDSRVSLQC